MLHLLDYPFEPAKLSRKRLEIKKFLQSVPPRLEVRFAILGGSTTRELREFLHLFLRRRGVQANFYEGPFGQYYEEAILPSSALKQFRPDIVLVHLGYRDIKFWPRGHEDFEDCLLSETRRLAQVWSGLQDPCAPLLIQSNFSLPVLRPLGNLDACEANGKSRFVGSLNQALAEMVGKTPAAILNDANYLANLVGLEAFYDDRSWHNFRIPESPIGTIHLAHNIASLALAGLGQSKKCLVLDLDNTLWGGEVGEVGAKGLALGADDPLGEAYSDFHKYLLELKRRGVLLAICSKNDESKALEGFSHPDSLLQLSDFSSRRINWAPKHINISEIAQELSLGLDSFVFVDDSAVEREAVRHFLPEVAVPEVGREIHDYARILDRNCYFEAAGIVAEDLERSHYYSTQNQRMREQTKFDTYDDFLASLNLCAEIAPFADLYADRITQLINKTNQFNLTLRRVHRAEVDSMVRGRQWLTLYGRLRDRLGDSGLVTVLAGEFEDSGAELHIRLWLMSCRVLGRGLELLMFESLVELCKLQGVTTLVGYYKPSEKNNMVSDFYLSLGFTSCPDGSSPSEQKFKLEVDSIKKLPTHHIRKVDKFERNTD